MAFPYGLLKKQVFEEYQLGFCLHGQAVTISQLISTLDIIQTVFLANKKEADQKLHGVQMTPELNHEAEEHNV